MARGGDAVDAETVRARWVRGQNYTPTLPGDRLRSGEVPTHRTPFVWFGWRLKARRGADAREQTTQSRIIQTSRRPRRVLARNSALWYLESQRASGPPRNRRSSATSKPTQTAGEGIAAPSIRHRQRRRARSPTGPALPQHQPSPQTAHADRGMRWAGATPHGAQCLMRALIRCGPRICALAVRGRSLAGVRCGLRHCAGSRACRGIAGYHSRVSISFPFLFLAFSLLCSAASATTSEAYFRSRWLLLHMHVRCARCFLLLCGSARRRAGGGRGKVVSCVRGIRAGCVAASICGGTRSMGRRGCGGCRARVRSRTG